MTRTLIATAAALMLAACSQAEAPAAAPEAPPQSRTAAPAPTPAMAAYTAQATETFSGGRPVTPEEVATLIHTTAGAQGAIAALDPDGGKTRWTTVLAGIASGAPEWLALVTPLEPGAENASYVDLLSAVQAAMVVNPSGVLAILNEANPDLSAGTVCHPGGFEPEPAWLAAFYDALTPAVESVTDPALADSKAACLAVLHAREGAGPVSMPTLQARGGAAG